jgi:hypothetical protein
MMESARFVQKIGTTTEILAKRWQFAPIPKDVTGVKRSDYGNAHRHRALASQVAHALTCVEAERSGGGLPEAKDYGWTYLGEISLKDSAVALDLLTGWRPILAPANSR